MEQNEHLQKILDEIQELKTALQQPARPRISDDWVSRDDAKEFFKYGETQITQLEKNPLIITAKVGKRIFISKKSIVNLIESKVVKR